MLAFRIQALKSEPFFLISSFFRYVTFECFDAIVWLIDRQGQTWAVKSLSLKSPKVYLLGDLVSEIYMGRNFLTQPDPIQYSTDQTQPDSRIYGKDTTRPNRTAGPKPKAVLLLSINYFKCQLLFCMHVKNRDEMQHKTEHSINIKLSSVTRGFSSNLTSPSDQLDCLNFADCRDLILVT